MHCFISFSNLKKIFTLAGVLLLGILLNTNVEANSEVLSADYGTECVSPHLAKRYQAMFSIDLSEFPGGADLCDPKNIFRALIKAIYALEEGKFSEEIRSKLDVGFVTHPFSFFQSRISQISFYGACSELCYYGIGRGRMLVGPNAIEVPFPIFVSSLVHEAKHFDWFGHSKCWHGIHKGALRACDDKYDGKSYSVGIEYMVRVFTRGLNFNEEYKTISRMYGAMNLYNFINESGFKPKPALALVSRGDQRLLVLKSGSLRKYSSKIPDDFLITPVQYLPGYLGVLPSAPEMAESFLDLYAPETMKSTSDRVAQIVGGWTKYRNSESSRLLSATTFEQNGRNIYFGSLFTDRIQVRAQSWGADDGTYEETVKNSWRFATVLPSGRNGIFIVDVNLNIFEIRIEDGIFWNSLKLIPLQEKWPFGSAEIVQFEGKILSLNASSGEVSVLHPDGRSETYEYLKDLRFSQMKLVTLYDELDTNFRSSEQ